jgi:hypothetical protein
VSDQRPGNGAGDGRFEILRQSTAAAEPCQSSFDHARGCPPCSDGRCLIFGGAISKRHAEPEPLYATRYTALVLENAKTGNSKALLMTWHMYASLESRVANWLAQPSR